MAADDGPGADGDHVGALLAGLADRLVVELADHARIETGEFLDGRGTSWELRPTNPRSAPVRWMALDDEIVLQAGRLDRGGRWELERTPEDVEFVEVVVRAAIAGRVVENSALARSRVDVTLEDERELHVAGYEGCLLGLLPSLDGGVGVRSRASSRTPLHRGDLVQL